MGRNPRIGLLDDTRTLVLTDEEARNIAERLHYLMAAQGHPLSYPPGSPHHIRPFSESGKNARANQYGGKGVIKFNPTVAEVNSGIRGTATLVDWSSPDGQAHALTVEVGRILQGGGGSFPQAIDPISGKLFSYRANAQVIYGTPGAMQESFLMDINRGQRFTVTASYMSLTAQMGAPNPAVLNAGTTSSGVVVPQGQTFVSGSMGVFGNIGMGESLSAAPVLFTQYVDQVNVVAATGSVLLVIPEKANVLFPFRLIAGGGGTTTTLSFLDTTGTAIDAFSYSTATPPTNPFSIPDDAYYVLVQVTPIGTNFTARLVYQLSI